MNGQGPAVELRGLAKSYGRTVAIGGVDLAVSRGEVFGILGPNGAGKTTLLRTLCGLVKPGQGTALIDGIDVAAEPERAKRHVGYLDEEPFTYPNLTGREFLNFVADLYGVDAGPVREERMERLFDLFELGSKQHDLVGSYSHGTRQKIGLASLLMHEPSVLLLDEPTNGLDPRSARRVRDLLQELAARGVAILLSTHILEVAEALSDRVAIMNRGRFVAVGSMAELRAQVGRTSLEELFLELTGGPEERDLLERLLEP